MKVCIKRNDLLKALSYAHSIIEKKTTLPILSHILIQTKEGRLKITATDLEIALLEWIDAQIEEEGEVTVIGPMFYEVIGKLPEKSQITLAFDKDKNQLLVTCESASFSLSCLNPKEFPLVQLAKLPHCFHLSLKDLNHLLKRTEFAMSTEETRYHLNGIYLHVYQNQELRAVATDGHRLARASIALPEGSEGIPGVILSRKTVNEVLKILSDQTEDVEIHLSETQITFLFQNISITSRLIDGVFPDYEKAIPEITDKLLTVKMPPFLEAVERVSILSDGQSRGIKLKTQSDLLTLSSVNSQIGSAVEQVTGTSQFESIELGFNAKYLIDIAKQMGKEDSLQFSFGDPNTAVTIRNMADARILYVLMPMRL